ncbi:hypothetical protein O181_039540 [Austropuccinia psidii MF-1]|uniref:Uncharacterized protein n=1 Tax=Austropuccinia psidii MF-1 TaxID=1389203 RepID=A0A9Q3HF97_9BASI|nr:hypothetical protein [Austropuccinia psidii MF-1]
MYLVLIFAPIHYLSIPFPFSYDDHHANYVLNIGFMSLIGSTSRNHPTKRLGIEGPYLDPEAHHAAYRKNWITPKRRTRYSTYPDPPSGTKV